MTASALLSRAGVDAITVTKYPSTADSPRAHITNQRTVEVLRDLGVEATVVAKSMPQELMGQQVFAESFAGLELSRAMAWGGRRRPSRRLSAGKPQRDVQHLTTQVGADHP